MKSHVTAVGVLHIGLGIFGLIGGSFILLALSYAGSFVEDPDIEFLLPTLGVLIGGLLAVISAIDIIGGIGLLKYKAWARILVLITSALGLLNIPVGTAVGIYSIVILVHPDTTPQFEERPLPQTTYTPPPPPPAT